MSIDEIAGRGEFFTRSDLRGPFISHREVEKRLDIALRPTYIPEGMYALYIKFKYALQNR